MGGYKGAILSRSQSDRLVDTLSQHGIEVIAHDSPDRLDAITKSWPLTIKYGAKEIRALKFLKTETGERGIVFLSFDPDDFECIDMMIALLSQPVDHPDCGTQENQAGGQ